MLAERIAQNISDTAAISGDIYQFDINDFWSGRWIDKRCERNENLIGLNRKEYLRISADIPASGCITLHQISHAALYKILLARHYPHFGVTGIKAVYLILCLEGLFGEKYKNLTTKKKFCKFIGGRSNCSHASQEFWEICLSRIIQEDISERLPLSNCTDLEREIWRSFIRRASISCNRKRNSKTG